MLENSPPLQPESISEPIRFKDVLRAVFLPPQDEPPLALPHRAAPKLWPAPPGLSAQPEVSPDLATLDQPAAILYENSPIPQVEDPSAGRMIALGSGTALALLLAYLGQSAASSQPGGIGATLLFGMAAVVWLGVVMFEIAPPDGGLLRRGPRVEGAGAGRTLPMIGEAALNLRIVLGVVALGFAAMTYMLMADNTFTTPGLVTWIASVLICLVAFAEREPRQWAADSLAWVKNIKPRYSVTRRDVLAGIALLAIFGAGAVFRLCGLEAERVDLSSGHVEKLLDAYDVSQGIHHIFMVRNGGREAIQFYLVALASNVFGTGMSFTTLKLVTAVEALLLLPVMVAFGREMVDRETGHFAAALVAVSWWHVMLGRLALRIVLTPLLFALVLMALIRGIRTGSRRAWLWAGIWLGVGVYGYQAMRLAPVAALLAFGVSVAGPVARAIRAHLRKQSDAAYWRAFAANITSRQALNLALAGLVALAIFTPMLRVWHDFPDDMWNRVINRTTESEVPIEGSAAAIFLNNYRRVLGMFNFEGDGSWFSAIPGQPMFDVVGGALFVVGVIAWAVRLRVRRDPVDLFIVLAGLVMLLPSALAIAFPIENPSATRASGVLPIVFVLAAWPLALIRQRWTGVLGGRAGLALSGLLIALILVGSALVNYRLYFVTYADSYRRSALNPGEVADAVREQIGQDAPLDGVWLQGWPFWHDYRAIGVEAGDITFSNAIVDVPSLESYLQTFPDAFEIRPLVFIVHPQDIEALGVLQTHFPDGQPKRYASQTEGRDFILYIVTAPDE